MHTKSTTGLEVSLKREILELWNREYPAVVAHEDLKSLDAYFSNHQNGTHHITEGEDGEISGWIYVFDRNGERWFSMAVRTGYQGKGIGTALLHFVQERNDELNGWIVLDQNYQKRDRTDYKSPVGFYIKNGFRLIESERLEKEELSMVRIKWTRED